MKLIFRVRFHTSFGQSLFLCGNHPSLGSGRIEQALPLQFFSDEFWQGILVLPEAPDAKIVYNYFLRNADGSLIQDWENSRAIHPASFAEDEVLIIDSWNDTGAVENTFYTEPFKNVLLKADFTQLRQTPPAFATHTFKVKAPLLKKNETLCLVGSGDALGHWSTETPQLLNRIAGEDFLTLQIAFSRERFPIEYKYGIYDLERGIFVRFEDGENRKLYDPFSPGIHTLINDGFVRLPATTWRGAGVAIPVFSLRSENSFGVGEFTDLKLLADWGKKAGLKLIQILPVNDSIATHSWHDSYPYAAISAFALHPLYLNLSRVVSGKNKPLLKKLEPERKRLNALDAVDYPAVIKTKLDFMRQIFPSQKGETFATDEFRAFFERNAHWLKPYAAFCCLREKFGTADFNQWPKYKIYRPDEIEALISSDAAARDEIELNYFIQFHLRRQLKEAAEHAHANGIILKGDIAIGVYRHSADVWQSPELFHTELQAGAPPDPFSDKGQNWGFPTYNWPRMLRDDFAWWKRRFEQMSACFDAFRIDHILGFFRIWSIPAHAVEGILGYFVPAIPVRAEEFQQRGIAFDRERFVQPFITDDLLREMFGEQCEFVKREFLNSEKAGHYSLKPEFATQRQIEKYFTGEENSNDAKLKQGLFDLIANVILLEVQTHQGLEYHFRFFAERTPSFKHLDAQTQSRLKELYVDYFFRRQDVFWMQQAMQKLPALKRVTNMLICGEDLGLVPACVPDVMKHLGLLSLEIQRMPKQMNCEFSRPADAPYLSVVTPSTHDMSTIRGWWEEDRHVTQKFFNHELGLHGDAPRVCPPEMNESVVLQHLASPAMWSVFQLQDLLGMNGELRRADVSAERINVPADPKNRWCYRMHLTLEALQQSGKFNEKLSRLIHQCGR